MNTQNLLAFAGLCWPLLAHFFALTQTAMLVHRGDLRLQLTCWPTLSDLGQPEIFAPEDRHPIIAIPTVTAAIRILIAVYDTRTNMRTSTSLDS